MKKGGGDAVLLFKGATVEDPQYQHLREVR
jgi:hypothetical protein